jgi:hypothetical protein
MTHKIILKYSWVIGLITSVCLYYWWKNEIYYSMKLLYLY